ncbi:TonB-dependent receptor domain-containing protein [Thalassotalea aquiviva]|uniref:TonB-dependent receptor domain-containing protein n=1 Tax=Thalassotalea aquiviva TaxID=3242415 RepID=UPI00352A9091
MKKTIIATTLSALLISSFSAISQPTTEVDEHILISANRSKQQQFSALSANAIIEQTQIEALQVNNISELLNTIAGIHVVNQGGAGQNTSLFLRGSNFNQTLILVDGIRIGSASLGASNLSNISPSQIERIEVIKGPRAALWGSDAIGGVIQIFTKQYQHGEGSLRLGIGSHHLKLADAAVGLGSDEHQLSLSLSTESSTGFNAYSTDELPYDINEPDKDGYDRLSFALSGTSKLNDLLHLELVGRYDDGLSEYDASYPDSPCWDDVSNVCPSYYANKEAHENYSLKVASVFQNDKITSTLSLATIQDKAETFGNGIRKADAEQVTTKRQQVSFINQYRFSSNLSSNLGMDYYREQVSTNTDQDSWLEGFQSWTKDHRDVKALFLQTQYQYAKVLLEGALRYDDVQGVGNETTYNASIGYQLSPNWLFAISRSSGFKAPTFNDLYWPGSGNANLAPEKVSNSEVLIRHRFNQGQLEFSAFDSKIKNLIAWAPNANGLWQPDNINSAHINGVEFSANANWLALQHQIALTYLDTKDNATGEPLLRRPKWSANYSASYQWQKLTLTGLLNYRDKSLDSAGTILKSYTLMDVSLGYSLMPNTQVNLAFKNIFDKTYENAKHYVADGRHYKMSINYIF